VKCVEILLDNGSHVDYQDEDLWSPLHMAAACNHINIVQLLLEHGADTTLLDVDSKFALDHTTDANIHSIISDQMAENGIYEEDLGFIRSRLYKAMLAAVRGAVSKHKDLKIFNKNGVTPLHIASANGYIEIMKLLIRSGNVPLDVVDDYGHTPLDVARKFNQANVVEYLTSCSEDMNVPSNGDSTDGRIPQPSSTKWKITNITKYDSQMEGEYLKDHSNIYVDVEEVDHMDVPTSHGLPEMIYDTCISVMNEGVVKPKATPNAKVEEIYDNFNAAKTATPSAYEDVAIVTGIRVLNVMDSTHDQPTNENGQNIVITTPQPYEKFVRHLPLREERPQLAVQPATPPTETPPRIPPKKPLIKSKSVDTPQLRETTPTEPIPEAWRSRMIPKPRSIPVAIARRGSTPNTRPPPLPPARKNVSVSALPPLPSSPEETPPPLPPRLSPRLSPKSPHPPPLPSYEAILQSPDNYPLATPNPIPSPPIGASRKTSVPTDSALKNRPLPPSPTLMMREERVKISSPRPYRVQNIFQ
jgi:hypothetical protein